MDLIVRNFQSIVEAKFRVEGLTVLVGESSAGKSACLKAVRAAFTNRFKIGQVRHGEEYAEIKARMEDDPRVLVVQRSPLGSPAIKLGDRSFSKLSRSVPAEVAEFLNLGQLEVGGDIYSLNFHSQFDKPLLLAFSQKKVMEILAASQGIDDLNTVHYSLSKKREQNRGAFNQVDALLNEYNAALAILNHDIAEMEPLVTPLQKTIDEINKVYQEEQEYESLQSTINEFVPVKSKLKLHSQIVEVCGEYTQLDTELAEYTQFVQLVRDSRRCAQSIDFHTKIIDACGDTGSRLAEFESLLEDINEFVNVKAEVSKARKRSDKAVEILDVQDEVDEITSDLKDLELLSGWLDNVSTYNSRIDDLNKVIVDKICPVCGSKFE